MVRPRHYHVSCISCDLRRGLLDIGIGRHDGTAVTTEVFENMFWNSSALGSKSTQGFDFRGGEEMLV
jgi:hypothetical protein